MDYRYTSIWGIILRFVIWWGVSFGILCLISCVMYWDFITASIANNMWAVVNALMPSVIIILAIIYCIRLVFR